MKCFGLYIIYNNKITDYALRIIVGGLLSVVCCFVTGCRDTLIPPEELPRAEAERTVIIYMISDNTPYLPAREDTTEMAKGKNLIPENVNFIIYLDDRGSKPAIYELSAKNGITLWKQYEEEQKSTDASVMLEALSQIETYFPARHYGITFWSHATGWAPEHSSSRRYTFGKDQYPASEKIEMEIPVLRDVLAHFPKFDYIFFDACFMQCIEVAYELRGVTNFMVGSPAEIPGPGAPYDKIIDALCKGDALDIVRGYDSGYPSTYKGYTYPGVLLSCIDCTQLEPLAAETGRLLYPFYKEHTEPYTTGFQSYCDISWNKFTYSFDMRTTMCRLLSGKADDFSAWDELFKKAVPFFSCSSSKSWYAAHCTKTDGINTTLEAPEYYGGVSMFVPMQKYDDNACAWNESFQKTSWYEAAGWAATGW